MVENDEAMLVNLSRIWPTLAAIALIVATVALGRWQLDRAQMREERAERYDSLAKLAPVPIGEQDADAEALDYRPVIIRGEWLPEYGIFLDNQVYRGQAGYHVYMPLRLAGRGGCILVNRGWVAAGRDRSHLPVIKTTGGCVEVYGIVQTPLQFKELGAAYREGRVWQNVTLVRFMAWSGLKMHSLIVRQTDDAGDELIRDWPRPDSGAERNRAYALQWFALAGLTFILWAYYFFKRRRDE